MHEFSIASSLVDELKRILKEQNATSIKSVDIEVGEYSNIVPELLNDAFNLLKREETIIKDAELKISVLPLKLRCKDCGFEWLPEGVELRCVKCKSTNIDVLQGMGILLREVVLEKE